MSFYVHAFQLSIVAVCLLGLTPNSDAADSAKKPSAPKKLTNIDYMGLGYDAYIGNPHNDLYDPGFRQAIFQLSYTNKSSSSDGKWLVPDNVQVLQTLSCSYSTQSNVATGMTSYQNGLSVDATVEGSGWGAKFSASVSYKEVMEGTSNYHNTYVSTVAKCLQYRASTRIKIAVSDDFSSAVKGLPTVVNNDRSDYLNFINAFGTHYASVIVMGAKVVIRSEFEETAWTSMQQSNIKIDAAASASFNGITGGASVGTEEEKKLRNEFNSQRLSYKAAYLGSQPSTDGKWETWAQRSGQSPYPIEYTLRPITELFDDQYFPSLSASELSTKRKLLSDAFAAYCKGLENCGVPTKDLVPVRMDKVESSIKGTQDVSCRPGFSLLSCGLDNIENTAAEAFRRSYPVSSTSCRCYDYFGAKCVVWCTNSVSGFEIKSSDKSTVSCPAGKKVVGCQINEGNSGPEGWRAYYPSDDGNSCICYDYFGAQCVASCASNIYDHEIRKQYGHGVVTVSCSEKNYVLGCGIDPRGSSTPEKWRTVYVSSMNSCKCYDYYGATCYAICGKFK